jgi:hypothetical protein
VIRIAGLQVLVMFQFLGSITSEHHPFTRTHHARLQNVQCEMRHLRVATVPVLPFIERHVIMCSSSPSRCS